MTSERFTRYEAAAYLDLSVDTLDRLHARGAIPALHISKRLIRYLRADLDAYLATCRITPSPDPETRLIGTSNGGKMDTRSALRLARQIAARPKRSLQPSGS